MTDGLMALVGAEEKGLGFEETKAALDELLEADLVVWEAGGENHMWRISSGRPRLPRFISPVGGLDPPTLIGIFGPSAFDAVDPTVDRTQDFRQN